VIDVLPGNGPYGTNRVVNNKKPKVVTDGFFLYLWDHTIKTVFCSGYSFLNHQSGGSWYCRRLLKLTIEQPASVTENSLTLDLCVQSACPVSLSFKFWIWNCKFCHFSYVFYMSWSSHSPWFDCHINL